nr:MAG TPA: hypothetical protein [Bacteriophage sp.]
MDARYIRKVLVFILKRRTEESLQLLLKRQEEVYRSMQELY